jgi:outer membrane protein TolC
LRSAQSSAASAADALKSFLGRPLEEEMQVAYAPTAEADGPGEEGALVTQALARRPDLLQLDLGLRQAALTLRMTEAQTRPGLDLESGYGLSGEAESIAESWHKLSSPSWYVGLTTSVNLSHTESRTLVEQARARLRLTELDAQLTREAARLEIRELLRRVNDAAANAAVLEETRKLAEENLRIRQTQFEHGLIRPIDVAQTARELTETRYECLAARIDLELARAQLQLATGEMPYRGGGVAS